MEKACAAGEDEQFLHATLRHFSELRSAGPQHSSSSAPFPDDWFDLPEKALADLGAFFFLAALTRYHRSRSLADLFANFETPMRLGQYKLFRSNGFPRALITWAGLGPDQEFRFAVDHQALKPEDWNSGPSLWLVDFIAPFGHVDQIVPLLTRNPDVLRLRTLWHNKPGTRYRIIEWSRESAESKIEIRSFGAGQFKRMLKGELHGKPS